MVSDTICPGCGEAPARCKCPGGYYMRKGSNPLPASARPDPPPNPPPASPQEFDYLLNAFEQASQHKEPASVGYADKRRALLAHVAGMRSAADERRWSAAKDALPDVGDDVWTWDGTTVERTTFDEVLAEPRLGQRTRKAGEGFLNPNDPSRTTTISATHWQRCEASPAPPTVAAEAPRVRDRVVLGRTELEEIPAAADQAAFSAGQPHTCMYPACVASPGAAWRPIDQRGKEDCERCCWAMLLGLPYESVPDFFQVFKDTRRDTRHEWVRGRGMDFVAVRTDGGPIDLPVNAYCIAGVASPTGHPDGHAVFGKIEGGVFKLLHDPNPQREKSGTVPYEYTFLVQGGGT